MSRRRHSAHGRRRSTSRRSHGGIGKLVRRLIFLCILAAVGWWAISAYLIAGSRIQAYPADSAKGFIVTDSPKPVMLVVQQGGGTGQLDRLMVARISQDPMTLQVLELPSNLSNGRATVGQLIEQGSYRQAQQAVEQAVAMPINGYMVQPRERGRGSDSSGQGWANLLTHQQPPSWWDTTVNLPWWLNRQPTIKTSLNKTEVAQLVWLLRDIDEEQVTSQPSSSGATAANQQGYVESVAEIMDPLVAKVLVDQQALDEGVTVVIKNATEVPGLAAQLSRYIKHLGGEVVAVDADDTGQEESSLRATTASRLSNDAARFLGVPFTQTARTGRERADLEIIAGQDILGRIGEFQSQN